MDLQAFQECRSLDGWVPIEIQSHSNPNVRYIILVNPWGRIDNNICECDGYMFRGRCRHQQEAQDQICGWSAFDGPEVQNDEQEHRKICPRCGESTRWVMEAVDADS